MNITIKIGMSKFEKLDTKYSATKTKQYMEYKILHKVPKYFYITSK